MTPQEILKKILAPLIVWLAISFLLIYNGNSMVFSGIMGAFGALPFLIEEAIQQNLSRIKDTRKKISARNTIALVMNLVWLAAFLYTLLELFEITSSEVILSAMILILSFSKWKETAVRISKEEVTELNNPTTGYKQER